MVSFVCGNCQDVVKKNKVDSHCIGNCRNAWEFTCIDCNVTFEGFDYKNHNQCITEEEKYCGKFLKTKKSDSNDKHSDNAKTFTKLIEEILRSNGEMDWVTLRDLSVKKYCESNKIEINDTELKNKLNWECLASIPITYTSKSSNKVSIR